MSDAPLLEARGLRKVFGEDFVAVADCSLALEPARSIGIVGESGSGKTTVARMLVGLEVPTAGTILFNGQDRTIPARAAAERRRRGRELQIVFQDPYSSLDPRQSCDGCLDEVLRLHFDLDRTARAARVAELADLVGLDARQRSSRPGALSGGQRQRVAIARALAAEPAVLILDESVAALDVSIQAQILNLLGEVRRATGVALVFISHDLAVVRQLCDEVLVMQRGDVVERGDAGAILDAPQAAYTQLLLDSVPRRGWRPQRRGAAVAPAATDLSVNSDT
jgi:ABC-type glutathione transport system ATPase component